MACHKWCIDSCLGRLAIALAAMAISGCGKETEIQSAAEMFEEAVEMQAAADYEGAINMYADIQASHPFGAYAQQSLLNQAHLHYVEREYDKASSSINRFIQEYPSHANLDYALYLKALTLRRENPTLLDRLMFADQTNYSLEDAIQAHDAFLDLATRFPESRYTPDAVQQASSIVDELARRELETALHYLRKGAYGASMNRASDILRAYPDSHVLEPALAVVVASLVEMRASGPLDDAKESLRVSFPNSPYLEPASGGAETLLGYMGLEIDRGDFVTRLLDNS